MRFLFLEGLAIREIKKRHEKGGVIELGHRRRKSFAGISVGLATIKKESKVCLFFGVLCGDKKRGVAERSGGKR